MVEPFIFENVLFIIIGAVFSIVLVSILVYWSLLAKKALEKGRIRVESMMNLKIDRDEEENLQNSIVEYAHLKNKTKYK